MNFSIDQLHPLVLNAGLAIHNADWNWKNIVSPFVRLYYVTEGTAQIELPSGIYQLKPQHMYFIPAFTKHNTICDSYFCHYYMHIYEENQQGKNILDEWNFPVEIPGNEMDLALIKRFCAINPHMSLQKSDPTTYDNNVTLMQNLLKNKQRAFYDKVESRGIVYQLLSHFMKYAQAKSENRDERLVKVLSYIHNHINKNLNIDELAEQTCLSKDHFIRLFKHEIKTTPLQYINQKKIEEAQLTLVTSDTSVKDIALNLGFEDYSYFNRLFKKLVGTTPQEYRHSYY